MKKKLPPSHVVYAFEAAARHLNFSKAARELGISQPAISRSIALLESETGRQLFNRTGPKVTLTPSGAALSVMLTEAFDSVGTLINSWQKRKRDKDTVLLSISTSMASHWLIPRLFDFRQAFPDVDLQFELLAGGVGNSTVTADLGLRRFAGIHADFGPTLFLEELIQPVASRDYIERVGTLDRPRLGRQHTLIALTDHWCDWVLFARQTGLNLPPNYQLLAVSDYSVALQSAINGQGVVLGWLSVTSRALSTRALHAASESYYRPGATFNLVPGQNSENDPVVNKVREWLISQIQPEIDRIRQAARLHAMGHQVKLP